MDGYFQLYVPQTGFFYGFVFDQISYGGASVPTEHRVWLVTHQLWIVSDLSCGPVGRAAPQTPPACWEMQSSLWSCPQRDISVYLQPIKSLYCR